MRVGWVGRGTRLERRLVLDVPPGGEIIAHRGFSQVAPELTLAAYGAAVGLAHSMECDVQFSADGVPVLLHDTTVDRTSDLAGAVSALTIAQLEAGDFGSWFDATRFTGVRIPRFTDWLSFVAPFARMIYPEIKGYRSTADIAVLVRAIVDAGMDERCVVTSFVPGDFRFVRALSSSVALGYTGSTAAEWAELLPLAAADGNAVMVFQSAVLTADPLKVRQARALGVDVVAWTVDQVNAVRQLNEIGVYRIMSNQLAYVAAVR
jgi:glycerophosphoryl diester phosphodiesterase